ncbi:M23 family metallopeptidase [Elioraea sp.]|uniref:M23 family metallopeptidase n=1 Tax=Elioraea sp. TaxID=2185103 RepID=UPI0021DBB2F2|nr:M23 family metallopeptidase [Elioraea sp.]GIX09289.1 MAG: peptidase [Elioraea sp.]
MIARRLVLAGPLCLLAAPARAITLHGRIEQGAFVTGTAAPGTRLALDGRPVRVAASGAFALGFGRDAAGHAALAVTRPGGTRETIALTVARRQWIEQHITGLPPAMVTPPPETLERIAREREMLREARGGHDTPEPFFTEGFDWPVTGRISGVFGSRRILNGEPRQPHFGVDVARPTGTPVAAACSGIVRLAQPEMYFPGSTVVLDHGHAVSSTYMHLSRIDVRVGQRVAKGAIIGAVGATGRVTGPHLHFEIGWRGTPVDPQTALPPMPEA